jgi:hypothetical protein
MIRNVFEGRPAAAAASPRMGLFSITACVSRKHQRAGNLQTGADQTLVHFQNQNGFTKFRGDISTGEGQMKELGNRRIWKYQKSNINNIEKKLNYHRGRSGSEFATSGTFYII